MKVIDASVLVAAFTENGVLGDRARRHLNGASLVSPELVDIETCAALRHLESAGRIPSGVAAAGIVRMARLPLERHSHAPLVARCWQLRHSVTSYDAAYVALAEAMSAPLVTTDARLARASGPRCTFELLLTE